MRVLLWCGMVCAATPGGAFADDDAPRARIERERAQAEARYEAEQARCQDKFVVSACLDRARQERRAVVERLDREQVLLDDRERRERAAERLQRIEEKQREAQQRLREPAPSSRVPATQDGADPAGTDAAREAMEAERAAARAQYEARHRAAAEHRAEVLRRNAANARHRAPRPPLPRP